ncbi:hypothetical protein [Xylophilus ampelinus]|uniref:Uncharacterized protein n=1 Tax=Xylophilus ampelinus TaxID=54067 RepID=A0A318SJD3_9BURK|nr:hypothetical protein [Xylophilus ampelinus]MCS4511361.1 hypothetical protein [Xylophilus ampelinus]PYE74883.1 hypothetical protein DFQ15_12326 [Xylophilus ampelinus]
MRLTFSRSSFTRCAAGCAGILAGLAGVVTGATAQTLCNSDGAPAPRVLQERFLDADCTACWSAAASGAVPGAAGAARTPTLDWIVPSAAAADGAAMSAAALPEAQARLDALRKPAPSAHETLQLAAPVGAARPGALRVARGAAVADYVGVSIAWNPPRAAAGTVTAWLVLAEALPAGADGSAVERLLVRGALTLRWQPKAGTRLSEARSMRVPETADPARLRMVGWVEDGGGRILTAAASVCRSS